MTETELNALRSEIPKLLAQYYQATLWLLLDLRQAEDLEAVRIGQGAAQARAANDRFVAWLSRAGGRELLESMARDGFDVAAREDAEVR